MVSVTMLEYSDARWEPDVPDSLGWWAGSGSWEAMEVWPLVVVVLDGGRLNPAVCVCVCVCVCVKKNCSTNSSDMVTC